jgi:hypothetical protein
VPHQPLKKQVVKAFGQGDVCSRHRQRDCLAPPIREAGAAGALLVRKWQRRQVGEHLSGSAVIESAGAGRAPNGPHDLKVDKLRSNQLLPSQPLPRLAPVAAVISKGRRQDRGIDDDRAGWRSARSVSVAKTSPGEPPARPPGAVKDFA